MKRIASSASDLFITSHKERLVTSPVSVLMSVFHRAFSYFCVADKQRLTLKKFIEENPWEVGPLSWVYRTLINFLKCVTAIHIGSHAWQHKS
jgi:hypothetical protein